ncbi:J domain-containing protein [Sulfurimonas marina]|uniref:J domain-containing protein n=1 Tax=Sulfurimonas marina TaxID=2590551 RepID=A0A7M1AXC6_9BACT|nr:J domain-containing protein [Sulfurimonas marina]QOP41022.1 J domain-containing protein [Sulfurimonas marina]
MEERFIIFNGSLGVHDFVTIGEMKVENEKTIAWLEEPYEMVGPFDLNKLRTGEEFNFAACVVMSQQKWKKERIFLQKEALKRQQKAQQEHYEDIRRYNRKKQYLNDEKKHREVLCLPLEGVLEAVEIKAAYRRLIKTEHPDVGGSHEKFIEITAARDALLKK